MSGHLKRLTAVVGVTVALAGGMTLAAPSALAADTPSVMAVPCGLSGEMRKHTSYGWEWYYYNIRNCHSYAVNRRVNVSNTVSQDGRCHWIPAGGTVSSRMEINTLYDGIHGLASCG